MYIEYAELNKKYCDKVIIIENIFDELNSYFMKHGLEKYIFDKNKIRSRNQRSDNDPFPS